MRIKERNGTFSSRSLFLINLLVIVSTVAVGVSVYDAAGYHFSDLITLNNEPMRFEKVRLCNFSYPMKNVVFLPSDFYQSIKIWPERWNFKIWKISVPNRSFPNDLFSPYFQTFPSILSRFLSDFPANSLWFWSNRRSVIQCRGPSSTDRAISRF